MASCSFKYLEKKTLPKFKKQNLRGMTFFKGIVKKGPFLDDSGSTFIFLARIRIRRVCRSLMSYFFEILIWLEGI